MNKKAFASIIGLGFIAILALVFVLNLLIPDKSFSAEENRMLQEAPGISISAYQEGRLQTKIEDYVDDQFLLRNTFIKIKTSSEVTSGSLESNGVYRCKDNYLMEDISAPNQQYMTATIDALKKFRKKYSNMKMYFLLAPNAANILSDKLPATVRVKDQNKYMDDFFASLKKTGIKTIDVRDTLKSHADTVQVYYRTDHHWTTDGAWLAYNQAKSVMKLDDNIKYESYAVKNDFRGTLISKSGFVNGMNDAIKIYLPKAGQKNYKNSIIYYSDTKEKTTEFYKLDNLKKKDAYTVFGGSNHPLYTISTPTKSTEKLLLVKDSYANSFIPFIAQDYREIVVVDPRYFFDNINDIIKSNDITQVLFLYNANTFFTDDSLEMMLNAYN
jgi:hypothetical protein